MRSMTGYGRVQGEQDGMTVSVEIRSVNQRFLKLAVTLPEDWQVHQARVENAAKTQLSRGVVTVKVRRQGIMKQGLFRIDTDVLNDYRGQLQQFASPGETVPLSVLVTLPGVVVPVSEDREGEERIGELLEGLTTEAVVELVGMRRKEGDHLAGVLNQSLDRVEELLKQIRSGVPEMVQAYRDRLTERLKELLADSEVTLNPGDVARELAFFAERSDIAEELDRLASHVKQFRALVETDAAVGRQLEFLVQEMFREANTMSSKAGGIELGRMMLELKGEVDRLKEQVMNVE